jgi:hypothetical protein
MTVQSRGPRSRRGGRSSLNRGPGWVLLTALLVLAILASSTLVFTSRVELLRLAVVLSLWAAVMAAFVTVIYRRQSDVAQARARDMKFVYDLQLEREISARREYELSVETHLRRQLSQEARAQAADEVAALRAELASLRSHLEVMLGTDLAPRPALESDRITVPMPPAPGRVESSRVTMVTQEIVTEQFVAVEAAEPAVDAEQDLPTESPIIDVAEEPLTPAPRQPLPAPTPGPGSERYAPPPAQPEAPWRPPELRLGRHAGDRAVYPPAPPVSPPPVRPEPAGPRGRHWVPTDEQPPVPGRHRGASEAAAAEPGDNGNAAEPAEPQGQHADGQSFADLMQRLQANRPMGGGGRRRRDD